MIKKADIKKKKNTRKKINNVHTEINQLVKSEKNKTHLYCTYGICFIQYNIVNIEIWTHASDRAEKSILLRTKAAPLQWYTYSTS